MRRFLLILFIAVSPLAKADGLHEVFQVVNNKIIWQRVFESSLTSQEITTAITTSGAFSDIVETDNSISCRIVAHAADYKTAGISRSVVAMYVLNYNVEGHALIQFKEGRYRVTVDRIVFINGLQRNPIELYALKNNGTFKDIFFDAYAADVLASDFFHMFYFTEPTIEDKW